MLKVNSILQGLTLVAAGLLASCASAPGLRMGQGTAPTAWAGEESHLFVTGTVGGVAFSIILPPGSPELKELEGKREFQVLSTGEKRYTAFEVSFKGLMEGLERELELEFENADFQNVPAGATLVLQEKANEELAPEGLTGLKSNLEMEWEWEDSSASSFSSGEVLSKSGKLTIMKDSGQMIGGTFEGVFENGRVSGSFTVPKVEEESDDVDAFYL
jgi:hypothetical protein